MPYRKLDRTELADVAGLDDVTTWEAAFPTPWLLGVMAAEELWVTSVLVLVSRDKSSVGLDTERTRFHTFYRLMTKMNDGEHTGVCRQSSFRGDSPEAIKTPGENFLN